jgi:transposase
MRKYRTFTAAFKQQVVEQVESGGISVAQAAREFQLSPTLIDRWRRQYAEGQLIERPSAREKHLERELEQCKKKIADLVLEVDLLKKLRRSFPSAKRSSGSVVTLQNMQRSGEPAK